MSTRRSGWSVGAVVSLLAMPAFAQPSTPSSPPTAPPAAKIAGLVDPPPPRRARAGQCFVKVLVPEVRRSSTRRLLVTPARRDETVRPGICRTEERLEVVRPPTTTTTIIPAVTEQVLETRIIKPAGAREETLPAVYQDVTSQVMVEPAHLEWRLQGGGVDTGAPPYAGGAVRGTVGGARLCLVETPAVYQTLTQRVMTEPGRTVRVETPAQTVQVSREVVVRPERREVSTDPGETRRVPIKVCAADETVVTETPAVYRTETEERVVAPAHYAWRPAACGVARRPPPPPKPCPCGGPDAASGAAEASASTTIAPASATGPRANGDGAVARLQAQLKGRGYYAGPVDGLFTPQTMAAMTRFQRDHHLPEGRYTQETAAALSHAG